jgi:hypothetical protein
MEIDNAVKAVQALLNWKGEVDAFIAQIRGSTQPSSAQVDDSALKDLVARVEKIEGSLPELQKLLPQIESVLNDISQLKGTAT